MLNFKLPTLMLLLASAFVFPDSGYAKSTVPAKLQGRLTATWQGQELGAVLKRIADSKAISLWVDRRVDQQQVVNAQFTDTELKQVLDEVLNKSGLGWSSWDEIIYIGPRDTSREMATLMAIARQSLDKLAPSRQRVWMTAESVTWPRLSDPREVLKSWLDQGEIRIKNPKALSHDLWDAGNLPPLPLADRVALVLLGFEKTYQIAPSGKSIEIVPITRPMLVTEEYQPGRQMRDLLAAFRDDKSVTINRQGNHVAITGRWEDQQRAREIIEGSTTDRRQVHSRPARLEQRFSLKLENQPVGKVVEQLASQLELTVNWPGDAQLQTKLTSCEIQDSTVEDLLQAVLAPAGLGFSLDGKQLTIRPSK